jgi:hypothetical protein
MVRSDLDEGVERISLALEPISGIELRRFSLVFLLRGQKKEDTRKKEFLNST